MINNNNNQQLQQNIYSTSSTIVTQSKQREDKQISLKTNNQFISKNEFKNNISNNNSVKVKEQHSKALGKNNIGSKNVHPSLKQQQEQYLQAYPKNKQTLQNTNQNNSKSNKNNQNQNLKSRNNNNQQFQMREEDLLTNINNLTSDYDLNQGIQIELKAFNSDIHLINSSQTLPVLITLNTLDQNNIDGSEQILSPRQKQFCNRSNIDLMFVIDISGSIQGQKIQNIKSALLKTIDILSDNDRISIVVFNAFPILVCNFTRMTQINKGKLKEQIKDIGTSGITNIYNAMCFAYSLLHSRKSLNPITSVFLLSDGQDNSADETTRQALYQLNMSNSQANNFTIHSFGYGPDQNGEQMIKISNLKDGTYYFVDNLQNIDEYFFDALGSLFSVVSQDVNLEITLNTEDQKVSKYFNLLQITQVNGCMNTINESKQTCNVLIKQLLSGTQKSILIDLALHSNNEYNLTKIINESVKLLKVKLSASSLDKTDSITLKEEALNVNVKCNNMTSFFSQSFSTPIGFHQMRFKISQQLIEVLKYAEKGDLKTASSLLTRLIQEVDTLNQYTVDTSYSLLRFSLIFLRDVINKREYNLHAKYKTLSYRSAIIRESSLFCPGIDVYQNHIQKQLNYCLRQMKIV